MKSDTIDYFCSGNFTYANITDVIYHNCLSFNLCAQKLIENKKNLHIPYCEDQQTFLWRSHTIFSTQHDCQNDNNTLVNSPAISARTLMHSDQWNHY